jgi:hypothetical protein
VAKGKRTSVYFDRKTREFVGLDDETLTTLKNLYPKVNVDVEIFRMRVWLDGPKGVRRKGDLSFITNWLSRACNSSPIQPIEIEQDSSLKPFFDDYMKDLWEKSNAYPILALNKRKSSKRS